MIRQFTKCCLITLILASSVSAARAGELDAAIRSLRNSRAEFTQHFTPRGFRNEQVERGSVLFGAIPQMRWTYSGAEPRTFVFDGQTSWLYSPTEKQVQVTHLDATQKQKIPFAFLWDAAAARSYRVKEKRDRNEVMVTLTPLNAAAELKAIELAIGAADHTIHRVQYTDRGGNRTSFEFKAFARSTASSDTFRFVAPGGVEVIQN